MTKSQLIEAMIILNYVEDTDYTIDTDYASIEMVDSEISKPSEEDLQLIYDQEQIRLAEEAARLAEEARLDAIQARIDALDVDAAVAKYVADNGGYGGDDGINMAFLKDSRNIESDKGWYSSIAKPTIDQLETADAAVDHDAPYWTILRAEIKKKLEECDFTQLPDVLLLQTQSQKDDWIAYRTTLRDLPANTSDPRSPSWPTEPT